MKQSETITKLSAALVKVQEHIQPIAKDRENTHFRNKYATLDAIMESIRAPLASVELAIVQGGGAPVSDINGAVIAIGVETMLVHSSGEFISSVITLPIAQASPQAVGSAITYGRRYGVASLLALTTEEDDDANHATAASANAGAVDFKKLTPAKPAPVLDKAAVEKALDVVSTDCPKCGGPTWDNRVGKKNPKAPDFKCRDRACDGVIWPPKEAKAATRGSAPAFTLPEERGFAPADEPELSDADFLPF